MVKALELALALHEQEDLPMGQHEVTYVRKVWDYGEGRIVVELEAGRERYEYEAQVDIPPKGRGAPYSVASRCQRTYPEL